MLTPGTLLVVGVVVVVLVGTKRIRTIGEDLGAALRSFRRGLQGEDAAKDESPTDKTPPAV